MGLTQTVASNVRTLQLERGYTQEALSKVAGINHNYAGMIEREERSVRCGSSMTGSAEAGNLTFR